MKRKKILFVMVEGRSEETAFGVILGRLYPDAIVHVHVMHGDITASNKTHPSNIMSKITAEVKEFARSYGLKKQDFQEVIHLIDTDGAFVPPQMVHFSEKHRKIFYTEDQILTAYPDQIEERNKRKTANVNRLIETDRIWESIPYQVYYMSTNLEHVLVGKLNCSNREKEKFAFHFAMTYKDHLPDFLQFMTESPFSVDGDYLETWDFIENKDHSLQRFSNYGLSLEPLIQFPEELGPKANSGRESK